MVATKPCRSLVSHSRRNLFTKFAPVDNLDQARAEARRTRTSVNSARFAVDVAGHELENAQATLAVGVGA